MSDTCTLGFKFSDLPSRIKSSLPKGTEPDQEYVVTVEPKPDYSDVPADVLESQKRGLESRMADDKFATDVVASASGWNVIFVGATSGARSRSQRTLTIVIKFDNDKKVRDFAYHSSRF